MTFTPKKYLCKPKDERKGGTTILSHQDLMAEPAKDEECLAEFLIKAGYEQKEYFLMGMATGIRMIAECFQIK